MSSVFPIIDDPRYRRYTASAAQTDFNIPFPFQQAEDIKVLRQVAAGIYEIIPPATYKIEGANNPAGGTLNFTVGRVLNEIILILGDAILDRLTSIVRDGKFSSQLIEGELDRIRIIEQEFRRDAGRALKVDYGASPLSIEGGIASGSLLYLDGSTIRGGPPADGIASSIEEAAGYAAAALSSEIAAAGSAAQAAGSAAHASTSAGQAQNLVDAAQAAYVGFQPGTFYDLGRVTDPIQLFPGDLGRVTDL